MGAGATASAMTTGCAVPLLQQNGDGIAGRPLPPLLDGLIRVRNNSLTGKNAFFYIDDVIWLFRDLTRQRPAKLFDNPFLAVLREAQDRYGLKVQLNCFYRTDFFYGADEFTLAEMTDDYKAEWQANKGWLRLGFHSLQEFPDYPFINADYGDVVEVVGSIKREITRFAGEDVFATGGVCHWGCVSKDTCRALEDLGITVLCSHCGTRREYNGDPATLPYGHAMRLLQNRKPETCLFRRVSENDAIASSIAGYNLMSAEQARAIYGKFDYYVDPATGIGMKELEDMQPLAAGINLYDCAKLPAAFAEKLGQEFVVYGDHEQYFYRDYLDYQPDYAEKIFTCARLLRDNGYEHFFLGDLAV